MAGGDARAHVKKAGKSSAIRLPKTLSHDMKFENISRAHGGPKGKQTESSAEVPREFTGGWFWHLIAQLS